MANGANLGNAYVTIMPEMTQVEKGITDGLTGSAVAAATTKAGKGIGAGVATGAAAGLKKLVMPAAVAVSAGVAAKALYEVGEEFNNMSNIIARGTGATGADLEKLNDSAKNVGANVGNSFDEVGQTIADFSTRMGLAGAELETVATKFLKAGSMLGESIDLAQLTGAFNAFSLSGEEASEAMDDLFTVSQSTGISMNSLIGAIKGNAGAMQSLGFDFQHTAAMAGLLDKAGIDASSTFAKMSKGLVTLAKDGEQPQEAFQRITQELQSFIDAGDDAAALNLASEIFGTRGAAQFVQAVKSGTLNIEEMTAALADNDNAILNTASNTGTIAGKMAILSNNFKELAAEIGVPIFDILNEALAKVTPPLKDLAKYFRENKDAAKNLVEGVALAGAAILGLKVASKVTGVIGSVAKSISGIASKATTAAGGLTKLGSATSKAGKAFGASAKEMAASALVFVGLGAGIILAAAGVALLAQSAIALSEHGSSAAIAMLGMVAAFGALVAIMTIAGSVGTATAGGLLALGASVLMVSAGLALVLAVLPPVIDALTNFAVAVLPIVIQGLQVFGEIIATVFLGVIATITAVAGAFNSMAETIGGIVVSVIQAAGNVIIGIISAIAGGIALVIGSITGLVVAFTMLAGTLPLIAGYGPGAALGLMEIAAAGLALIPSFWVWGSVADGIERIGNACTQISASVWSARDGMDNFRSAVEYAQEKVESFLPAIQNTFNQAQQVVNQSCDQMRIALAALASVAYGYGWDTGISFANAFNDAIKNLKMPHFHLKTKTETVGDQTIELPESIQVDWYAKGGIFNRPSVIGVGEAGREAVVPLSGAAMQPFADAIADHMGGGKTINVYIDGARINDNDAIESQLFGLLQELNRLNIMQGAGGR